MFQIVKINAYYSDDDTYFISDTDDASDSPRIIVNDNGDGTWTAYTDDDNVIIVLGDGSFEIRSIDVDFAGPEIYRISDMHSQY